MKKLALFISLLLCSKLHAWIGPLPGPQPSPAHPRPPKSRSLLVRMTAYWTGEVGGIKSALGNRLRPGHCAVDPKKIPYGSRIQVGNEILVAVDTGRDVRNRKAARKSGRTVAEQNALVIDRFFPTKRLALAWAARNPLFLTVTVIPRT